MPDGPPWGCDDPVPCAAGHRGGGKVGILLLDFHFSTAHSQRILSGLGLASERGMAAGAVEMWKSRAVCEISKGSWETRRSLLLASRVFHSPSFPPLSGIAQG